MDKPSQKLRIVPNRALRKPRLKSSVIKIFFITLTLFFLFYRIHYARGQSKVVPKTGGVQQEVAVELPVRLIIPAINVDASIESVGVTKTGEMDIPSNTINVGWFNIGPRPGEKGSAVIAGHLNGKNGETGVFAHLDTLKKGDKVYIANGGGPPIAFVVRENKRYDPGYAEEVFGISTDAHLNLVTCDGVWDGAKKSYTKRLVVFADML